MISFTNEKNTEMTQNSEPEKINPFNIFINNLINDETFKNDLKSVNSQHLDNEQDHLDGGGYDTEEEFEDEIAPQTTDYDIYEELQHENFDGEDIGHDDSYGIHDSKELILISNDQFGKRDYNSVCFKDGGIRITRKKIKDMYYKYVEISSSINGYTTIHDQSGFIKHQLGHVNPFFDIPETEMKSLPIFRLNEFQDINFLMSEYERISLITKQKSEQKANDRKKSHFEISDQERQDLERFEIKQNRKLRKLKLKLDKIKEREILLEKEQKEINQFRNVVDEDGFQTVTTKKKGNPKPIEIAKPTIEKSEKEKEKQRLKRAKYKLEKKGKEKLKKLNEADNNVDWKLLPVLIIKEQSSLYSFKQQLIDDYNKRVEIWKNRFNFIILDHIDYEETVFSKNKKYNLNIAKENHRLLVRKIRDQKRKDMLDFVYLVKRYSRVSLRRVVSRINLKEANLLLNLNLVNKSILEKIIKVLKSRDLKSLNTQDKDLRQYLSYKLNNTLESSKLSKKYKRRLNRSKFNTYKKIKTNNKITCKPLYLNYNFSTLLWLFIATFNLLRVKLVLRKFLSSHGVLDVF